MKLTTKELRMIIKEELNVVLTERQNVLFEQQLKLLKENDKIFKAILGMLTGLGLAVGQQVAQLGDQKAQQVQAKIEQAEEYMDSNADKEKAFEKFVYANPGRIFSWTDDTLEDNDEVLNVKSKETLPMYNIGTMDEPNYYFVLPPEWSVAEQVLLDKQQPDLSNGLPYISVPGSNVGEMPSAEEVESVLSKRSYPSQDQIAITFIDNYKDQFVPVPSGLRQFGNFQLPMEAIPDDLPMFKTSLTKREQYITYYFGQALGKEDAKKFTEYYENKLTLDVK